MLDEEILTHPHDIGRIPHGLDLRRDEILGRSALKTLFERNPLVIVVVLVALIGETRAWSLCPLEFRIILKIGVHKRPVGQVFEIPTAERIS